MNARLITTLDRMPEGDIVEELGWDAFFRYKVACYQRQDDAYRGRFSLLTHLGMTDREYDVAVRWAAAQSPTE